MLGTALAAVTTEFTLPLKPGRIYSALWKCIVRGGDGLLLVCDWPDEWECIYQPSHLFQAWRGQQAPMEMQGGCHWPSCHGALASLLYQQADRKGKNRALAYMDKRCFIRCNPSARGKLLREWQTFHCRARLLITAKAKTLTSLWCSAISPLSALQKNAA